MQELIEQLTTYIKGIWLKKHYILIAVWIICPIGWYMVWKMPDQYSSSAQVYVDTQSLLRPLLRGLTVQPDSNAQVRLIVRTLLTRPNLEKIMRMSDLDVQASNDKEFEDLLDDVKSNLTISMSSRENIYTITYKTDDPNEAKVVVQSALDVFIENTLGETRNEADTAELFLERQIKEYEERLLDAEKRLTEFKQANSAVLGVDVGSYYSSLKSHKDRLAEAQLQLQEVNSQLDSAKAQLKGEEPSFGLIQQRTQTASINTQYDSRIDALNQQLDELSLKYTNKHPNIIELKRRIRVLERQRNAEVAELKQKLQAYTPDYEELDANPVYQQLKLNVTRLENQKVSLDVRVREFETKVEEIEEKIHLIPEIESQLIGLNRGYEITRTKYNELLTRREQARLSQNADLTADDIQFKVVEPPRVPLAPSGPNRLLFNSVVLIAGLMIGLGLAFVMSQLRPVVISGSQLAHLTGYPVFGSVSLSSNSKLLTADRRRDLIFLGSIASLIALYAVIMVIQLSFGI